MHSRGEASPYGAGDAPAPYEPESRLDTPTSEIPIIAGAHCDNDAAGAHHVAEKERIPVEIWIILSATCFIALGFGLIVPVLPQFAASFGVTALQVTIVVSAFAFMRLVAAPLAGFSSERFGEQRVYTVGLLIVAASSIASAFAADYWQLLMFRALGGIGSVLFTVASGALVIRFSPPSLRGRISSMWGGVFLLGSVAGPVIGGLLGQLGMRVPFIAYGIALIIAAGIIAFALHRPAQRSGSEPQEKLPPLSLKAVSGDSAYRASLVTGFAGGWANFGVRSAVIPLFVAGLISAEPWAAGTVVAVGALGNILSLVVAGSASDRHGRKPYLLLGLAVAAIGFAAVPLSTNLVMIMLVSLVCGIGSGMMAPALQATVADVIGREHSGGRALATFQMSQDIGMILGPIVAGALIDASGYGWPFWSSALLLAVAALAWMPARETVRKAAN